MEIIKLKSQLSIALDQVAVHLGETQDRLWSLCRRGQAGLTRLERVLTDKRRKLMEALRAREDDLQELLATSLDSIMVANEKVARFRSQLFVALGNMAARVQTGQKRLTRLGRSFVDKPRRAQKALRSRENDLRNLLANSPDAIVVTNLVGRFVSANPKARDLFGVSEANMRKFTVDAFLSHGPIPELDGNGSPFRRQNTRQGKCEVRRLDGSLRITEYSFVANFAPFRHLYKFQNVAAINQFQPATLRMPGNLSIARPKRDKAS